MPKFFPNLIAQEISKDPTCYFMTRIFYFTVCVISHSVMSDSVPPWTAARQGSNPSLLTSPALAGGFFTTNATREVHVLQYQDFSHEGFRSSPGCIQYLPVCLDQRSSPQAPQVCSCFSSWSVCVPSRVSTHPQHPCQTHLAVQLQRFTCSHECTSRFLF